LRPDLSGVCQTPVNGFKSGPSAGTDPHGRPSTTTKATNKAKGNREYMRRFMMSVNFRETLGWAQPKNGKGERLMPYSHEP
jgi:hypothetical protein